jgi:hypothetical protein
MPASAQAGCQRPAFLLRSLWRWRPACALPHDALVPSRPLPNPILPNPILPNPIPPNPILPNPILPNPILPNPILPNPIPIPSKSDFRDRP